MKKQSLSFFGLAITLLTAFSVNATEVAINNLKAGGLADSLTVRSIDQTKVTKLTLSGNVNGADVIVIRRMAGCNETGGETDGYALSELDMTGSNIVEGGGKYLTDDAQHEYFTENKVIGKYFFYNCKNLKKYTFPASVKSMVGYAFFQNDSVRIVRFPESSVCTDLGFRAFSECESLSSITLPEQISKIPDECFYFTPDLTQISIPENVKEIGLGAFAKSGITSLTLPSQIDSIGEGAFQNCVHLAGTIHLPGSLRAIDGSVFLADTSLVAFEIDPSSTSMSTDANGFLFNANKSLLISVPANTPVTSYTVPEETTLIDFGAFMYNKNITNLTLSKNIVDTGHEAFTSMLNLSSMEILTAKMDTLPLMTDCRSLSKITAIDGPTVIPTSFLEGLILVKEFRIPSTIKEINDFAFRLTAISAINIPASVIWIREGALRNIQIDELTVAEGNSVYHMENGALFQTNHRTLITRVDTTESYTIDKDVTAIYAYAFANHGSMKKLFFEDNEDGVNIGVGAFFSCTNLEEVKLPNNLVTIPDGDFCADLSLKKFTIPATVQTIGIEALSFSNQTAINRINIPAAVTNIGNTAFYASLIDTIDVSWLTPLHLEYDANNQPVFNPKYISNMTLLVPQGTFAAYKAADQWKDFGTIVEKKITDLKETKSIDDILKVSVVNDAMILTTEEPRNVRIVNLAGQTEYTATVNRTVTVSVPNGVHIVQVGNTAIKVIVP